MKNKLIIDMDASFDSLVAAYMLLKDHPEGIECIMTVAGCFSDVKKSTERAMQANILAGTEISVFSGCNAPLAKRLSYGRDLNVPVHRREAIEAGYNLKCVPVADPSKAVKTHAVTKYTDLLRTGNEKYDILLLGPATNLACALRIDSSLAKNIGTLYVRAGAICKADVTVFAEKNAWADPEALEIVTHCGIRTVMLPLDTAMDACVTTAYMDSFRSSATEFGKIMYEGLNNLSRDCYTPEIPVPGCLLAACIVDPGIILETSKEQMNVCLDFSHGEGRTLFADANLCEDFNVELIRKTARSAFIKRMESIG